MLCLIRRTRSTLSGLVTGCFLACSALASTPIARPFGPLPLSFEPNAGQTDPQVKFLARGRGYTLFLTETQSVLTLKRSEATAVLRMNFLGSSAARDVEGLEPMAGQVNYFLGSDPEKWRRGIPTYG